LRILSDLFKIFLFGKTPWAAKDWGMKPRKSSLTYNPFQDLKARLKARAIFLPSYRYEVTGTEADRDAESEEKLFSEAMKGVTPISQENCVERKPTFRPTVARRSNDADFQEDKETLSRLDSLIQYGAGFQIIDTPEYVEGTGYNVAPEVARRLHRGDFSIQAHIDLHRLGAREAKEVFEKFLKWAVITGKRGVLIIHGRGLSSSSGPILKEKVIEWITHGRWRKWVAAYASARSCDGGAGATYALLRPRAFSTRAKGRQGKLQWKSTTFVG